MLCAGFIRQCRVPDLSTNEIYWVNLDPGIGAGDYIVMDIENGTKYRWEGSITMKYRFTFELNGSKAIFRAMGTHDILSR